MKEETYQSIKRKCKPHAGASRLVGREVYILDARGLRKLFDAIWDQAAFANLFGIK